MRLIQFSTVKSVANIAWCAQQSPLWTDAFSVWDQYLPSSGLAIAAEQQKFPRSSGDELLSDEDDLPHSELNQILDDDDYVSDMDYVPNSDSHDDDDDYSDASIHLMPRLLKATQIQEKVVKPDVGTSDASDTNILVVPSTSKHPPLEDPMEVASDSGNSIKDSSRDPEGKGELHEQDLPHLIFSKKNYCYICEDSKERKTILEKMRNKGNFQHNTEVLQGGTGPVKVKRKPKAKSQPGKFIHCMHCQGMYIRKELWRHVRRCPFKPENQDLDKEPGRTKVLALAAAHESAFSQQISSGVWKLLGVMKQDEIASIVRNDLSIIQFAQSLYNKHGQDPTKHEYLRQKLREVGRLLLCLRTDFSVQNLEEAVKPANFQRVVQAVKKVAGFDEEKASYLTPSLALKLGHALQKICDIVHCRALMAEDQELIRSTEIFKKLQMSKWSELVSHRALNTLSDAKYNKPSTLPFTEDVQTLHRYLDKSAESSFCNLKETATTQNYAQLAKVTLAQIIVFNRRRAGEVSKMRLKSFHERDNTKLHDDVAMGLPKSMSYYRGQDCLRVHASQCGAKHPEYLRLPVPTTQLAKISKLLLSMEKGDLSSMQGRSLDEIEIEEEIAVSDAEAKDRESEPESDEAGCGTSKPVDDADSTFTAAEMVSAVSSTVIETAPPSEATWMCPKCVCVFVSERHGQPDTKRCHLIPPSSSSSVSSSSSSSSSSPSAQLWQCQLSDLKLLTDYIINVTAVHSGGSSSYLSSFMLEDIVRPDPPVDVRVSPHNGRDLLVEWSPPSTWNDLDIFPLKYQIMYQWEIRGIPKSVNLGPFESSKVELKGLSPGRTYLFRVCARELLGLGKFSSWSSPVNITIPRTKP
ncbi:hypothetical protein F2P81_003259 [Scophthalmus maximus]|uniref:Fibronectin type-III domain-containing protein n=1 Tax=Scophthalmus maximus TaxID=52904 RepID=A0A6A4TMQ5_SCOMX|nr:hypothetical protein F2P81_003259 [Scophthalmus maximus]